MTQEQKKEIRRYEIKIEEIRSQLNVEVDKLADIFNQRDSALYLRDKAIEEKEKSNVYLEYLKKEISDIDEILLRKKKEHDDFSDSRSSIRNKIEADIRELCDRKDNLDIEISNLLVKYDNYIKLTGEYDSIIKKISLSNIELSSINDKIISSKKELNKSKEKADKIITEAITIKENNEKEFAILQEMRAGLDFYAERLRNWYHDKGLKLPEKFEIEKITKKT